jgi:hypothetical protein
MRFECYNAIEAYEGTRNEPKVTTINSTYVQILAHKTKLCEFKYDTCVLTKSGKYQKENANKKRRYALELM